MQANSVRIGPPISAADAPPSKNSAAIFYAICGLLVAINLLGFVSYLRTALSGRADFRIFYTAGYIVRTGQARSLYDVETQRVVQNSRISYSETPLLFNHAPFEALLFVPLSWLSYRSAYFVFLSVNCVVLVSLGWRFRNRFSLKDPASRWLPFVLLAGFLPISIALMQGQDSIMLVALFAGAGTLLAEERDAAAGLVLAMGLFKFQFVLPVAFLFAIRRRNFFIGFLAGLAALAGISLWLVGESGVVAASRLLANMSSGLVDQPRQATYMIFPAAMANLRGLVETILGPVLSHDGLQRLVGTLSVGLVAWCVLRTRSFANAVILAVLVSYHALPHDLSLLSLPISVLAIQVVNGRSNSLAMDLGLLVMLLSSPTILLFCSSRFYLFAIFLTFLLIFESRKFEEPIATQGLAHVPT